MAASALLARTRVSPADDANTRDPSRVRKSSYTFHESSLSLNSATSVQPSSEATAEAFRAGFRATEGLVCVVAPGLRDRTSRPAAVAAIPCRKSRRCIRALVCLLGPGADHLRSAVDGWRYHQIPGFL